MIGILRDINKRKRLHIFGSYNVHDNIPYATQRIKAKKDDLGVVTETIPNNSIAMHKAIIDTRVIPDEKEYTIEITVIGNLANLNEYGEATGDISYRMETRRFVYDSRHGNAYYINGVLQPYTPDPLSSDETMKLTDVALIGYPDKIDYMSNKFLYWKAAKKIEDDEV